MRPRPILPMILAPALMALAACGDDPTDPQGLLDSAEAEAVLRSAESLPLLPDFLEGVQPEDPREEMALLRARELWDAGTAADGRGGARRRVAIHYAAPALGRSLGPAELAAARQGVDEWIRTAEGMLRHLSMPAVEARLASAGAHLRRSDAAPTEGARVRHLLLATSDLVETTPRYVARSMVRDAEASVARAESSDADGAGDGPRREGLERARRLKDWAVQAVSEGEYLLAIQRAYYAMQLVEER